MAKTTQLVLTSIHTSTLRVKQPKMLIDKRITTLMLAETSAEIKYQNRTFKCIILELRVQTMKIQKTSTSVKKISKTLSKIDLID